MIKYWWVASYEFIVRIIYLKGLFLHPNVSEFHLLSYLIPLIFSWIMNGLFLWESWMDYLCEHIVDVLKTYGKLWLEAQYGI